MKTFFVDDDSYNYNQAKAVCRSFGANLATPKQMFESYNRGEEWCKHGWSEGQYALHPSQSDKSCGKKGLNGFYVRNVDEKFGANCYGLAPNKK